VIAPGTLRAGVAVPSPAAGEQPGPGAGESVLRLDGVSKAFGTVQAVDGASLEVRRGDVFTLLGPSGCGKSTVLRLVAGLDDPDTGEITLRGHLVASAPRRLFVPSHKRNLGMVFQSYAIWPHMTVFENVAYPLRLRGVKGPTIRERVTRVLDLVGLQGLEERPATRLSGGQMQRLALCRALVYEPDLLLLDEPFSNLDAKLREQMRVELKALQRRLGITILFVTHDQIEALSLSNRIAVMHQGRVEQVGSPRDLYERPASAFVRDFLGQTVILKGRVDRADGQTVSVRVAGVPGGALVGRAAAGAMLAPGAEAHVAVRPEAIEIGLDDPPAPGDNTLTGVLEDLLFVGDRFEARVVLDGAQRIRLPLPRAHHWREGQRLQLHLPPEVVSVWPA
jgi:ABC-type Fe3+/spermidine/putrescine transport system ATPase subunit